jgi:superfamily II DNA/RNA helicase
MALEEQRIIESRQHLIVSAPTNSGKSLLGYIVLLDAVLRGRRAILLEPLRALAQEQMDELTELLGGLSPAVFTQVPKVRISTGDYRLEGELPSSAPPTEGEIIIATPERFDAILRNPKNAGWAASIGAMVVDEAHLLGDPRRGPTLELLVASLLSMAAPPRIALLSATIGDTEGLQRWLHPCKILSSKMRTPLNKEVWQLEDDEDPDEVLFGALREVLSDPSTSVLVFAYRRHDAEILAQRVSVELRISATPYHSRQLASQRARTRADFLAGRCRCLITTTAMAMGVNLPATHVFVRDTTFYGFGKLQVHELLQILGRAGRGDRAGFGVVLLRPNDTWQGDALSQALREETLPPLRSSFELKPTKGQRTGQRLGNGIELSAATLVATCLARAGEQGLDKMTQAALLRNTLGGSTLVSRLDAALQWLADPFRMIVYCDEHERYHLTSLGMAGVRAMLPLSYIAGLGQLIRDLVSLDPEAKLLGRWSALDHLFVASLLSDRAPKLRRFSESLASKLDGWLESKPIQEKSLLFANWVMGAGMASKADELWGSLGLSPVTADIARRNAYVAMLSALVLDERSRGVGLAEIERRWDLSNLEGTEESWRDNALWLLSGHTALFEIRGFYHYLRQSCLATDNQVHATKYVLSSKRQQAYDLLERLKYCSALGPLMRGVRDALRESTEPKLGVGTIRKLESAGFTTLQQVASLEIDALVSAGIQKRFAKQIRTYVRRRIR